MPRPRIQLVAANIPVPGEAYPEPPAIDAQIIASHNARIAAGRAHWAELHSQQDPTPEWFADWLARIPSYGCSCRREFDAILAEFPPDFSSPIAFFERSVLWHNKVNEKLGRVQVSLDEAYRLHAFGIAS